uniref:Uncharacterized protein n=1 Tax=Zea mays TaxID=4577 RepID=B7ZXR5_MAIZE|nr:unknown [Zea mays]
MPCSWQCCSPTNSLAPIKVGEGLRYYCSRCSICPVQMVSTVFSSRLHTGCAKATTSHSLLTAWWWPDRKLCVRTRAHRSWPYATDTMLLPVTWATMCPAAAAVGSSMWSEPISAGRSSSRYLSDGLGALEAKSTGAALASASGGTVPEISLLGPMEAMVKEAGVHPRRMSRASTPSR